MTSTSSKGPPPMVEIVRDFMEGYRERREIAERIRVIAQRVTYQAERDRYPEHVDLGGEG